MVWLALNVEPVGPRTSMVYVSGLDLAPPEATMLCLTVSNAYNAG
jgi:hypothetical protein